jgi:hypothetical protein
MPSKAEIIAGALLFVAVFLFVYMISMAALR